MKNIRWIIVSAGTAVPIGIFRIWRTLQSKRTDHPLQKEFSALMTLGSSLVVLGIVFGTDRVISYSFFGAGILLSIINAIRAKKQGKKEESN